MQSDRSEKTIYISNILMSYQNTCYPHLANGASKNDMSAYLLRTQWPVRQRPEDGVWLGATGNERNYIERKIETSEWQMKLRSTEENAYAA